jgi:hypothetical protein
MQDRPEPFLVSYDYGKGVFWWWVTAPSAADILQKYNVHVHEAVPAQWSREQDDATPCLHVDHPDADLVKFRRAQGG